MADSKLTALTSIASAVSTDIVYIVDDPDGTPLSRRIKVGDLVATGTVKNVNVEIYPPATAVTTAPSGADTRLIIPADLEGYNLVDVDIAVITAASTGTVLVQLHNVTDTVDMLSTEVRIDATEKTSFTAATAAVISASNDDVSAGDEIRFDIDLAGTSAAGLTALLAFSKP